jgi:DNA-binding NarL/FixJ family response regulator
MCNPPKRKILIIDDDKAILQLLADDLTERGFAVATAQTGEEGLAAIARDAPDLILCDILMPSMSGLEVLSRSSRLMPLLDAPFICITAMAWRDHELQARRLGAVDYLVKPIDFDILAEIIKARLAAAPRDPVAAANRVKLSAREAEILAWSARGKTSLEIAELLQLTKRTVDFHVQNARRKLNVGTRVEAAVKAAVAGLIKP